MKKNRCLNSISRYLFVFLLFILPMLVSCKSEDIEESVISNTEKYHLYLDVDENPSYEIGFSIDDEVIGSAKMGDTFISVVELSKGDHELKIYRTEKEKVFFAKSINILEDTVVSFKPIVKSNKIELRDISIYSDSISTKTEMPDLTNMLLERCLEELDRNFFTNVDYGDVYDYEVDDYIVIGQNLTAGQLVNIDDQVILGCKKIKNYVEEEYKDLSLTEVRERAKREGIILTFEDEKGNNMNEEVFLMTEDEASIWFVKKTKNYEKMYVTLSLEQREKTDE